ncbi:hypothetical protein GYMLUDRAFT_252765 [Collybiopsis luxurians FD-317 M1]|uniref:Uncharacterized protein n=1 Tax=Collybiopsis luxurians FD-317 M1 TaxID=944289 RepID=A0A0D0AKD6_9AGAR|nr:hypothetical protein GYMLUDRAFT_252765 [Collybiopsis luxurians FD-317 M1]
MRTKGFSNSAIPANFQLEAKGINFGLGFYYANAALNLLFTLMIAGRIWWVAVRTSKSFGRDGIINKEYKHIIAILLECGIIYPITLIAQAATQGNLSKIVIPVNLSATVILVSGIAPTLIILRTCLGRSISQKVIDSQKTTYLGGTSNLHSSHHTTGIPGTKTLSSLINVRSTLQSETVVQSAGNIEVAIEMKSVTDNV